MVNISIVLSIYLGVCAALIKSCLASCLKGCAARSSHASLTRWPGSFAVRVEEVGSSSLVLTNQDQLIIAELHFNPVNTSSFNNGEQRLYRIHSQKSSHLFVIPLDTWLILKVRRRQKDLLFSLQEPHKPSGVSSRLTIPSSVNAEITGTTIVSFSSGNIVMDGKCLKEKYHHHHKDDEHHSHSMEETDAMPISEEHIHSSETAVNESEESLNLSMPYVVIISVCICSTLIVVVCVLVGVHHCQKRMLHRRKCLLQHQIIKRQQEEYKQQDVLLESNQESLLQISRPTNETNRENMPKTHIHSPCSFDCSMSDSINKLNWKRSKLSRQSSNVSKRLSEESNATTLTNLGDSSCTINRIYSNLRPDHICIHKNSITNIPWYPTVEEQRSHMSTDFRKQSLIRQQSCPPIEVHK